MTGDSFGIKVKDVVKAYRLGKVEIQALRGLNMMVEPGEVVAVIGPSGSGKTTLLSLVGGLDKATAGSIVVGGTEVTSLSIPDLVEFRRRTVGHIFQALNLIPTLSALENVELPMLAMGVPRGKRAERAGQLLEGVGLGERGNHKPDELSGGEQQRVAIATALANDPPILLADEPTGELDSRNAKIVTEYLVGASKKLGKTAVMVTHDPNVARAADRILRIEDGVIKASLTPAQLAEGGQPQSYIDHVRGRFDALGADITNLEEAFRLGRVGAEEFVGQRQRLKQLRELLQEELQRLGVVI